MEDWRRQTKKLYRRVTCRYGSGEWGIESRKSELIFLSGPRHGKRDEWYGEIEAEARRIELLTSVLHV